MEKTTRKITKEKTRGSKTRQRNRPQEKERIYNWRVNQRKREWFNSLKSNPCTDCGKIYHPAAMQWDHKPGTHKLQGGLYRFFNYAGKKRILEEIAKCELVCANCHTYRTWIRGQYKHD